jgi:hypothetical protein
MTSEYVSWLFANRHDGLFMVVIPTAGWLLRQVWKVRTNDLAHVEAALEKIDDKLNRHIEDHARGVFK